MKSLILAIMLVESGGDPNEVGDFDREIYTKQEIRNMVFNEEWPRIKECNPAIGPYQIHWRYWKDGCETLKVDWPYSYAFRFAESREVVEAYFDRYGKSYTKRTGIRPSFETLARIHNGGPTGGLKPSTSAYWVRVYDQLKTLKNRYFYVVLIYTRWYNVPTVVILCITHDKLKIKDKSHVPNQVQSHVIRREYVRFKTEFVGRGHLR